MNADSVFTPENRLQSVMADHRGSTPAELVEAATRNITELKPRLQEVVRRRCDDLAQLAARVGSSASAGAEALGASALGVCELAAACDMAAVSTAAQGVHAMSMAVRNGGAWHHKALNAHVNALHLLAADPAPAEAEAQVLLGQLGAMRTFIGVPA